MFPSTSVRPQALSSSVTLPAVCTPFLWRCSLVCELDTDSNPGNAILQSRDSSDYCDSTEWVGLLDDCLDCALEFEIWQYYSPEVKPAAEACGLNATPKPAGGDTTTSAAAQTTTQAAETQPASTAEPVTTGASTEAGHTAAPTTDAEHGHATAVHTTLSTAEAKPEATTPAGHESHKPSVSHINANFCF